MGVEYYKVDGGRLTFGEYWRMSPNPLVFLIVAIMKPFGGVSFNFSLPRGDELDFVDWDDLTGAARRKFRDTEDDWIDVGYARVFCHELPVLERHRYGAAAVYRHQDSRSFATQGYARDGDVETTFLSCVTRFDSGAFGCTTTNKQQFKPHPDHPVARFPGVNGVTLYERHVDQVAAWEPEYGRVTPVTPEALPQWILDAEHRFIDFHAERGVFVRMTKQEMRRARAAGPNLD